MSTVGFARSSSSDPKPRKRSAARFAYTSVPSRSPIVIASARRSSSRSNRSVSPAVSQRRISDGPGRSGSARELLRGLSHSKSLLQAGEVKQPVDLTIASTED